MQEEIIEGFRLSPQQRQLWLAGPAAARPTRSAGSPVRGALDSRGAASALDGPWGATRRLPTRLPRCRAWRCRCKSSPERPSRHPRPCPSVSPTAAAPTAAATARRCGISAGGMSAERVTAAASSAVGRSVRGWNCWRVFDYECRGRAAAGMARRTGECEHTLVLSACGVCADARSLVNLAAEVAASTGWRSRARRRGVDEAVQYSDFSEWQHSCWKARRLGGSAYWLGRGEGEGVRLPWRGLCGGEDAEGEAWVEAEWGAELSALVQAAGEAAGGSEEAALLSCWTLLLRRAGADGELSAPTFALLDGRKFKYLQDAIGPFAITSPVRSPSTTATTSTSCSARRTRLLARLTRAGVLRPAAGRDARHPLFDYNGLPDPLAPRATRPRRRTHRPPHDRPGGLLACTPTRPPPPCASPACAWDMAYACASRSTRQG